LVDQHVKNKFSAFRFSFVCGLARLPNEKKYGTLCQRKGKLYRKTTTAHGVGCLRIAGDERAARVF